MLLEKPVRVEDYSNLFHVDVLVSSLYVTLGVLLKRKKRRHDGVSENRCLLKADPCACRRCGTLKRSNRRDALCRVHVALLGLSALNLQTCALEL